MVASLAIGGGTSAPNPGAASTGWRAELALEFSEREGRTLLSGRRHCGPLQVQRPFYPEGRDVCHVYALHPPGGLVGGDELSIDVSVMPHARALVTTPAAGKVYRTRAQSARQRVKLRVGARAQLEWVPQETILYEGAALRAALAIELDRDARFIGWDAVCFGRLAAGESFARGVYRQCLELRRGGELVLVEPLLVEPGSDVRGAAWGLGDHSIAATLVATPAREEDASALSDALALGQADTMRAGITLLGDVLILRAVFREAPELRATLVRAWELLRPRVLGRSACAPRVWKT